MRKRVVSLLLALALCLCLFPASAFAADSDFTISSSGILTKYNGPGGDVVIPDGVTEIGREAFYQCHDLTSVSIPDSVVTVGTYAFWDCVNLTGVTLGSGVASIELGAFGRCLRLADAVLPDSVKQLGNIAFKDCAALELITFEGGGISIGREAFLNCTSLECVTFGGGDISIGEKAFGGCTALAGISFPDGETAIGKWAFSGCFGLESVTFGGGSVTVGDQAFKECSGLKSVAFGDGKKDIGDAVFWDCTSLENITFGSGEASFESSVFSGCTSLSEISFPEETTAMGTHMFYNCTGLRHVAFPQSDAFAKLVRRQDFSVFFHNCTSLDQIDNMPWDDVSKYMDASYTVLLDRWVNPGQCVTSQSERIANLAREITAGLAGDEEKARAIYTWVVENITYDDGYYEGESVEVSPERVLGKGKTICSGYAALLQALLRAEGIPAVSIRGKGGSNQLGHEWNAAFWDGSWHWLDATWDSTFFHAGQGDGLEYFDMGTIWFSVDHNAQTLRIPGDQVLEAPSDWAQEGVWRAICAGIVPNALQCGYGKPITRAEFCALGVGLYEAAAGREITERSSFTDTSDVNVLKLAGLGVINGPGDGSFNPDGELTREQAAAILARFAQVLGKPLPAAASTFNDNADISSWAAANVGQVQAAGLMSGVGDNNFAPQNAYSREQSILTIMRLYDYL